jgi:hypothetical protein
MTFGFAAASGAVMSPAGTVREKLNAEIAQLELALEELEAAAAPVAQGSPTPKPDRPAPVRALPEHLPREDVVAEPPSGTCACPDCGGALRPLRARSESC